MSVLDNIAYPLHPRNVERGVIENKMAMTREMVMITHKIEQSKRLCHKVVCLERGRVVLNGVL